MSSSHNSLEGSQTQKINIINKRNGNEIKINQKSQLKLIQSSQQQIQDGMEYSSVDINESSQSQNMGSTSKVENSSVKQNQDQNQKSKDVKQDEVPQKTINGSLRKLAKKFDKYPETTKQFNEILEEIKCKYKIKPNYYYKPRRGSQPFNILKILYLHLGHLTPMLVTIIREKYNKLLAKQSQKNFKKHICRLIINNYIKLDDRDKIEMKAKLIDKGLNFMISRIIWKQKLDYESNIRKEQENKKKLQENNLPINHEQFKIQTYNKQLISSGKTGWKMKLVINSNGFTCHEQFNQLCKNLQKQGSTMFEIQSMNSHITFFWKADQKILDFFAVFIGTNNSDLQFIKEAIQQAKQCKCSDFSVLAQFPQRNQNQQDEEKYKKITKFLIKARVSGINVWRAHDSQDTLAYLRKITWLLGKKIRNISETGDLVNHFGQLQKFNPWLATSKRYNLARITIKCLKRIRNMSSTSIRRITSKLSTLRILYGKLFRLAPDQRLRFMNWLLENYQPNAQANKMLVNMLFLLDYDKFNIDDNLIQSSQIKQEEQKILIGTKEKEDTKIDNQDEQIKMKKKMKPDKKQLQLPSDQRIEISTPLQQECKKQILIYEQLNKFEKYEEQSTIAHRQKRSSSSKQQQEKIYFYESEQEYITKN